MAPNGGPWLLKLITLVYRIEVQVRLLVFKRNSYQHGFILVWRCINFEEFFCTAHLWFRKKIHYFLKTANFWHPNSFITTDFWISSLLNIYFSPAHWHFLQDVLPACLFSTARLFVLWNSPTCTFIWTCISFWYTRVLFIFVVLTFSLIKPVLLTFRNLNLLHNKYPRAEQRTSIYVYGSILMKIYVFGIFYRILLYNEENLKCPYLWSL